MITTMQQAPKLHPMLEAAMGDARSNVIRQAFDSMEIAEQEIARAMAECSSAEGKRRINGTFLALKPPMQFVHRAEQVYRAHCRELIARAERGEDLDVGTKAEALCAVLDTALKAPLRTTAAAVAELLFVAVFGKSVDDQPPREAYPGAALEMINELRQKMAVPNRAKGGA
jgi:hypothetical protein